MKGLRTENTPWISDCRGVTEGSAIQVC